MTLLNALSVASAKKLDFPSWLGSPPETWTLVRLKHLLNEKHTTSERDYPPGAISFGEVVNKDMLNEDTLQSYQEVSAGEFVINPINLNYDLKSLRVALSSINVRVSPAYIVLQPVAGINPRYMRWMLYLFDLAHMKTLGAGVRQTITFSDIGNCAVTVPPPSEQERIANFLDEKTARIDALIAEKERLGTAVREYEQAELSRILTYGLGTHRIVPTGRPFITDAPNHWKVTAFKRALKGLGQGWSPQCESRPAEANEWGVLKVGCVNGTSFNPDENKALPPSLEPDLSCVLRRGDVLVSRANTRELVGLAALVEEDHPNLLMCDKLYRLQLHHDWVTPEYSVLLLRSDASRRQIELGASGASSSMQNISQDVIRELLVSFPPLEEQAEIIVKARKIRESCNLLVNHCAEHIDRLREYRSSLISAAVTGQLDINSFE
ncbi:MAG: restriction endonuclease subunit S, partial [Burkholderiaceae bacterium]